MSQTALGAEQVFVCICVGFCDITETVSSERAVILMLRSSKVLSNEFEFYTVLECELYSLHQHPTKTIALTLNETQIFLASFLLILPCIIAHRIMVV